MKDAASTAPVAEHQPYVPANQTIPEFGFAPVFVGAILGIVFGASSLYLALKIGMTVSASIPIAVLSVTLFRALKPFRGRNATVLENNMVQTTGSAGESIAFGVGATMPALLILGYDLELTRVMLVAVLGGLLGVLMMIPLRRMYIVAQHGKLKFPEGVACADVLIVGDKGGASARTMFTGFGMAFVYQFLMDGLALWKTVPTRLMQFAGFEFKGATLSLEAAPALLGVGYVIGPRIASIMVAGGVLASWVLVPAIMLFGASATTPIFPAEKPISAMSITEVWKAYVLYIGAGAVAAGGIISMMQSLPTILGSIRAGFGDLTSRQSGGFVPTTSRLNRDLSMKFVLVGCLGLVIAITAAPMLSMNVGGAMLIVLFGFLFVTVSARLTGEIGSSSNPISGMTVATLLMTCLVFVAVGWTGEFYRLMALSVAGIVCIACSNGGTVAQCLKTGYIVGATPRSQQIGILVGALTSALVIGGTLLILNDARTVYSRKDLPTIKVDVTKLAQTESVHGSYAGEDTGTYPVLWAKAGEFPSIPAGKYLVNPDGSFRYLIDPGINGRLDADDNGTKVEKFTAPKATLMAFIVDGILTQKLPWSLVLLGVAIAIVLELAGIPSLPFAVGVYLPMSASTPIFCGGMIRWFADKLTQRKDADSEMSPGILLSSGYIAGGTIASLVVILISLWTSMVIPPEKLGAWASSDWTTIILFGIFGFVLLRVGMKREVA